MLEFNGLRCFARVAASPHPHQRLADPLASWRRSSCPWAVRSESGTSSAVVSYFSFTMILRRRASA